MQSENKEILYLKPFSNRNNNENDKAYRKPSSANDELFEDNFEAIEYQKYQEEVKALETFYFKELMEDCKKESDEKVAKVNKEYENLAEFRQNEIMRTAKENVENKVNNLNEIEIIRTEKSNKIKTGTDLKGLQLDKTMLNDAESAVYVLQGKDFTKMSHIDDEAYVKINGKYVKATDKCRISNTSERSFQPIKTMCPSPNDVLKKLRSIVDQSVAHVELYSATYQTPPSNHPSRQLLELYNHQLQLYNQEWPKQTSDSQVLKSHCNNSKTTHIASNALQKMTEISVEISKSKISDNHIANPKKIDASEIHDVADMDLLKNLTQEEIAWFSRCNFCSNSLNMSNMGELLVHCRECLALDRSHGRFTYICYVCGIYNSYKSTNMKKHLLTHLGHKAFACDSCQYTCVTRSDLQRHLRKHTGEKPYACHLCDYKSSRTETLKKHLLNIHKIVNANYSIPELNVYNALLSGDSM